MADGLQWVIDRCEELGCGPGVYVCQEDVEAEVAVGLESLLSVCADPKGFTRKVNEELRELWEKRTGYDPHAAKRIQSADAKIANIRQAIEDGLGDAAWANERLNRLREERERLDEQSAVSGEAPQIDVKTATSYRRQAMKALKQGEAVERKQLLRSWVQEMRLAPEDLEIEINYQVPEPVMNRVVAGACYAAIHHVMAEWLVRRWKLSRKGRRLERRS